MKHVFSIIRSVFFAVLFISLQIWYLPRWVGIRGRWGATPDNPWRWLGLVPITFCAALALACVWRFGTTGEGTPARRVTTEPINSMHAGTRGTSVLSNATFIACDPLCTSLWQQYCRRGVGELLLVRFPPLLPPTFLGGTNILASFVTHLVTAARLLIKHEKGCLDFCKALLELVTLPDQLLANLNI